MSARRDSYAVVGGLGGLRWAPGPGGPVPLSADLFADVGEELRAAHRRLDRSRGRRADPVDVATCVVHAVLRTAERDGRTVDRSRVLLWACARTGWEEPVLTFWESVADGGGLASPRAFAATLPSSVAAEAARVNGLEGPLVTVTESTATAPAAAAASASATGCDWVLLLGITREDDGSVAVRGELRAVGD